MPLRFRRHDAVRWHGVLKRAVALDRIFVRVQCAFNKLRWIAVILKPRKNRLHIS